MVSVVEGKRWDAYAERFYIPRADYLATFGAMVVFCVSGLKSLSHESAKKNLEKKKKNKTQMPVCFGAVLQRLVAL